MMRYIQDYGYIKISEQEAERYLSCRFFKCDLCGEQQRKRCDYVADQLTIKKLKEALGGKDEIGNARSVRKTA